ncbi:Flp family type IVb pilin [Luteithermobacter gelatinilyticus]|uniref:Flp family type IVb pilin n=1 Tax=Luteithermobacter gelatinilyticus TaxID=2582913 RepID=UPI001106AE6F|nr:Flp family type IVb pilin [Luteithermobacter gelatinilyticus]|tara:strand:- start:4341 stop:4520 length:180 start_codon:yes stop_codon:yes gene_type:complete
MYVLLKKLSKNIHGATAIEYGLLAAILVVAVMTAFMAFGDSFKSMSSRTTTAISDAVNN